MDRRSFLKLGVQSVAFAATASVVGTDALASKTPEIKGVKIGKEFRKDGEVWITDEYDVSHLAMVVSIHVVKGGHHHAYSAMYNDGDTLTRARYIELSKDAFRRKGLI